MGYGSSLGLKFLWLYQIDWTKLSRKIGIPLTKSGRERKFGAMLGCLVPVMVLGVILVMGIIVWIG